MSDEILYLYTEDFFIWPKLKKWFKEILGRGFGGPAAVFRSLKKGLKELGIRYVVNQPFLEPIDMACVLSGVSVLKWAIQQKKVGKIKKILAGPNIVISPSDFGGILKHPAIDKIIVPSEWVRSFYVQAAPELAGKVEIWAAGVDVPGEIDKKKEIDFIVFNKVGPRELFTQIVGLLQAQNLKFQVVNYGEFHQQEYFQLLARAKSLIYLSPSESQGLALFEAWAHNVPTLVWEAGTFEREGIKVLGKISAPYLSSQAGLRFKDFFDFQKCLSTFISTPFAPRQYVMENFNHKASAQKYLDLIKG